MNETWLEEDFVTGKTLLFECLLTKQKNSSFSSIETE